MSQFMPLEILLGFGLFIYRAGEQVLEATSSIKNQIWVRLFS
jgi:hypothetical protein